MEMMNRGIAGAGNSIFIAAWILFGILLAAAPSTAQGTKDLLAYWTFDQAVGAWVADTMGEATGSLKGNMEWLDGADARFGKALRFDGSDGIDSGYVALPLGGALANPDTNAISFSVWLRSDEDIPTMSVSYRSVFNSSSGQDYYIMYYDKGAGQLRFKVSNTEGGAARPGIDASEIPKGAWYHVAAVYDGATAAIYLNGVRKSHFSLTGNVPNGQVSAIGCKGNSASQYWKGDMDDLAIWKRALTGPEIARLSSGSASLIDSASTHPEVLSGLLAHWDFDESIAAPVAEYRGLANGTLTGDAIVLSGSDAPFGEALRLNESGGVDSGFVALPEGGELAHPDTDELSFSVWLRSSEAVSEMAVPYRSVFDSAPGQNYYVLYSDRANAQLRFQFTNLSEETAGPAIDASEIPLGQWYHVAGVYDGVTAAIYLNGEEKDFDLLSGPLQTGQISAIGRKGDSDSQYWKGDLDDLAIWKRALSAKEIELLSSGDYAAGKLPWTGGGQSGIPCPEIIAHRGSSYIAPENTMAAFNLAWEQGSHGVELDVYLTLDKKIVCLHDSNLKRTTGLDKSVESCTWDEIKDLDAGSWKGSEWAGEPIPLLEDAIASIPYGRRLFIELKTGPTIVPYLQPLIEESGKRERIVVITFNYGSAVATREAMPDIPVMWLVSSADYSSLISQAVEAGFLGLDASYGSINQNYVTAAHEAGLEVYAWTINSAATAQAMVDIGVTGITTDRPDLMLSELFNPVVSWTLY